MTKISLETQYGKATIEVPGDDLPIESIFSSLVEPVLIASGYGEKMIDEYFGKITIEAPWENNN